MEHSEESSPEIPSGTTYDNPNTSTIHSCPKVSYEEFEQRNIIMDQNPEKSGDSGDNSSVQTHVEQWRLTEELKDFALNNQAGGRRLGVTWKDLTVKVVPSDEKINENILSQFNLLQHFEDFRRQPAWKTVLESSHGCVRPGEMLLVLGRPGSGCTTLLKILANKRKGYASRRVQ